MGGAAAAAAAGEGGPAVAGVGVPAASARAAPGHRPARSAHGARAQAREHQVGLTGQGALGGAFVTFIERLRFTQHPAECLHLLHFVFMF